jgi:hypothetical protein
VAVRYLPVILMLCVLVLTGCRHIQEPADKGEKPTSEEPKAAALQTSPWGEWNNGLQCRVTVAKSIEQGMPLEARIEFNSDLAHMPVGIGQLNTFMHNDYLTLILKKNGNEKEFRLKPYDPTGGMLAMDRGKWGAPLNGGKMEPWKSSFPLVVLRDELQPGSYTCSVEFSYPDEPRYWMGSRDDWDKLGFWYGKVVSRTFELQILEETPKTRKFQVPTRLRLEKELRLVCAKEGAQEIEVPLRNGFFIGSKVYYNGKLSCIGTLLFSHERQVAYWSWYKDGDIHATYSLEIFETEHPPVHMWSPGPGSGGYKVLWKKSFEVNYTEEEIKALK